MSMWMTLTAAVTAAVIAAIGGFVLIPYLKKIHFGQTILEEGPAWHKSKQGPSPRVCIRHMRGISL